MEELRVPRRVSPTPCVVYSQFNCNEGVMAGSILTCKPAAAVFRLASVPTGWFVVRVGSCSTGIFSFAAWYEFMEFGGARCGYEKLCLVGLMGGENPVAEGGMSSVLTRFLEDSRLALFAGMAGLPCRKFPGALGSVVAKLALSWEGLIVAEVPLPSFRLPKVSAKF